MINDVRIGMTVWIKSSVRGTPQRCVVEDENADGTYSLRHMDRDCCRVSGGRDRSTLYLTKEEAKEADNDRD